MRVEGKDIFLGAYIVVSIFNMLIVIDKIGIWEGKHYEKIFGYFVFFNIDFIVNSVWNRFWQ